MRAPLCLLLAVCALHAGAVPSRADEGFCPMGTADNWLPLTPETDVPELVQVPRGWWLNLQINAEFCSTLCCLRV